jgi:hypothetical protein
MPVDPYALCPCGSGKKLKFCCGDLAGEIEKIHRMIEGDQPRAALLHVEQSLAKHPGRASLLDLKAVLELSLEEIDTARVTVDQFVARHPSSPTARACQALLLAETGDATGAVRVLQRALDALDEDMPQRVVEAIGAVGQSLLAAGHILAAQAHLWLHSVFAPSDDTRSQELLVRLNHQSGLPPILREPLRFRQWPTDAVWAKDAKQAAELAFVGRWQQATAIIDRLGQQYGADPTLVYNRALLGGWLADERALAAGLHAFAQLQVPLAEAIEAEAIAQLLEPDRQDEHFESVRQTYEVNDLDALTGRFSSDPRVESIRVDPSSFSADEPRPRDTYLLLDKPMPSSGADLTAADIPVLAAIIAVYGRQTDQRERLEVTFDRGPDFDATLASLKDVAGPALGDLAKEAVVGHVSAAQRALFMHYQFPRDTPIDVRRKLLADELHAGIVDRWTEVHLHAFGGKTAREAAQDPELRIPLMAAVLILEHGGKSSHHGESIAALRHSLDLPEPDEIDATDLNLSELPLVRIPQLKLQTVSDDDLVLLYRRSLIAGVAFALSPLARESLRRPTLSKRIPPADAYRRMIAAELDPDRALELVDEARRLSATAGDSTAGWDLAELQLHILSGNVSEFQDVMERIEREHLHEPSVAQELYRLLVEAGMIPPAGLPMEPSLDEEAAAVGTIPESSSGIWTPDSERPAGKKSSLWTPS